MKRIQYSTTEQERQIAALIMNGVIQLPRPRRTDRVATVDELVRGGSIDPVAEMTDLLKRVTSDERIQIEQWSASVALAL